LVSSASFPAADSILLLDFDSAASSVSSVRRFMFSSN
jgi:hypothetical protein